MTQAVLRLAVSEPNEPEIFAALQGEGVSQGRPSIFVRLSQCNLHCWWCDTPYTWNFTGTAFAHRKDKPDAPAKYDRGVESLDLDITALTVQLTDQPCRRLVLTGGEPLLQQSGLTALCSGLKMRDPQWHIEVETNGTITPTTDLAAQLDQFNVSPKLAHSRNARELRRKPGALQWFADDPRANFKFVVAEPNDIAEISELCEQFQIASDRVWLMPEGVTSDTICRGLSRLEPIAQKLGFNLTDRLHIHLHGDTRGT